MNSIYTKEVISYRKQGNWTIYSYRLINTHINVWVEPRGHGQNREAPLNFPASARTIGYAFLRPGSMAAKNDCRQIYSLFKKREGLKRENRPTITKQRLKITALSFGPNAFVGVPLWTIVAWGSSNSGTNEIRSMPPTKQNIAPMNRNIPLNRFIFLNWFVSIQFILLNA